MSLDITIKTIKHKNQRYNTCGDWYWWGDDKKLTISISDMGDWRKEIAVALHELVEVMLCRSRDIAQIDVDKFDRIFEAQREEDNTDEPGDDPNAPYYHEHFAATTIERIFAKELGLDWRTYEETINNL